MTTGFAVLGPFEAHRAGTPLEPRSLKMRAVLALLTLHANEPVGLAEMLSRVWDEPPPPTALASARNVISGLRRLLEGDDDVALETIDRGYVLRVPPEAIDHTRFRDLADRGRALVAVGEPAEGVRCLREALELWRGPALADLVLGGVQWPEIAALEEHRLATVEAMLDGELALGNHREILGELKGLVADFPEREGFHRALIVALLRCQRGVQATKAYLAAHAAVREATGREPGPALRALHQHLLAGGDPEGDADAGTGTGPPCGADPRRSEAAGVETPAAARRAHQSDVGRVSRVPRPHTGVAERELAHEIRAIAVLCVRIDATDEESPMWTAAADVVTGHGGLPEGPRHGVLIGYFGLHDGPGPGDTALDRATTCALAIARSLTDDRIGSGDVTGSAPPAPPPPWPPGSDGPRSPSPSGHVASVVMTGTVMHIERVSGEHEHVSWVAGEVVGICEQRVHDVPIGAIWIL